MRNFHPLISTIFAVGLKSLTKSLLDEAPAICTAAIMTWPAGAMVATVVVVLAAPLSEEDLDQGLPEGARTGEPPDEN